jgi:hypothetical protein
MNQKFRVLIATLLFASSVFAVSPAQSVELRPYYLPKSMVTISILSDKDRKVRLSGLKVSDVPDLGTMSDLRHLSPLFDQNAVLIERTHEGLLKRIASKALDGTSGADVRLLSKMAITPETGLTILPRPRGPVVQVSFDPFNGRETAQANSVLGQFGFCLVLSDAPWFRAVGSDHIDTYCDDPKHMFKLAPAGSINDNNTAPAPLKQGVFYRPRNTHRLEIFAKPQQRIAQKRPGWLLQAVKNVELVDKATTISIGASRELFTLRSIAFEFDRGVLVNVRIKDESECGCSNTMEIPLEIVGGTVVLPNSFLKLRTGQSNNRAALIAAQRQLIDAQLRVLGESQRSLGMDQ